MTAERANSGGDVARMPLSRTTLRMLERARGELQEGRTADARETLSHALALAPDHPEVLRWAGIAAQAAGDQAMAARCFASAVQACPDDSALHVGLGIAMFRLGDTTRGTGHLRRACELAPASASAWFNLGEALNQETRTAEALQAQQRALAIDPSHAGARLSLARLHASLGDIDASVHAFREVLRREPGNARAWFGLANLNTVRFDSAEAEAIGAAHARATAGTEACDQLGFALAKALEDQGDYARAFEVFRAVNASRRRQVHWDAAGEHRRAEAVLRICGDWNPPAQPQSHGRELILIVSMPRAGSTLVEHILASHPDVEGANEIKDMAQVIDAESRRRHEAFPLWMPLATSAEWQRLGAEYLARTARWRAHRPRFTDKNLASWYFVGAALAMLPDARVVVVLRDPVETCLACWRQWLTGDVGFAYDLDEMADYCIDFMRLTRFWLRKFPARILDLEYETLVAQPEATIRGLLEFCGLSFDPACLDFRHTQRAVQSAPSAAQVREPLRRDTARAHLYGDKLEGLRARLRRAGLPA